MKKSEELKNLKVVKVSDYGIKFDNGVELYSHHVQECCEEHYLYFKDLTLKDFDGLVFNLSGKDFFKRIPGYGIELVPVNGHSVKVPGYGNNNGYYTDNLILVIYKDNEIINEFDISRCQSITN